jgi:hypothetical protein
MKRETQSQLSIATLVAGTKTEIRSVIQVIQPLPLLLVWFILVSTGFGFWDTFAGSFLIDHIKSFENSILTFLILGSLAIPAF